jgi:hypothetical protein
MARWELRRALRYGSKHIRYTDSESMAESYAVSDIVANGDVGRIEHIDRYNRILYYDIHPELE